MKTIKIFTKKNCAPCDMVKNYFTESGEKVEIILAFDNPDQASKFRIMSVPTVLLLEDDEVVTQSAGFNPSELEDIVKQFNQ